MLVGAHDAAESFALLQKLPRTNLMVLGSLPECEESECPEWKKGHYTGMCMNRTVDNCETCFWRQQRGCKSCKDGYKSAAGFPRTCEDNSVPAAIIKNGGKCIKGDFKILNITGSVAHTIRAIVKMPSDMSTVRQWILNFGQSDTGANRWIWNPTDVQHAGNQSGRWSGQLKGVSEVYANDQMLRLTTTFDGSKTYSFYIGGELKGTKEITSPLDIEKTNDLRVGLIPAGSENLSESNFTGCVTKVAVWDSALTPDDVAKQE